MIQTGVPFRGSVSYEYAGCGGDPDSHFDPLQRMLAFIHDHGNVRDLRRKCASPLLDSSSARHP